MQGYWSDLRAPEMRNLPQDQIAVLPLGATEQHGPHLPLSVDSDLISEVTARSLAHLVADQNVLVLPTLTVTKSNEHAAHPGTLTLSAQTLLAVLADIAASVSAAGVKRLVYFNGHGGNTAVLEIASRDARIAHGLITAHASWFSFADLSGYDPAAMADDIHAGHTETAAMLAVRPGRVDMSKAEDFRTALQNWRTANRQVGLSGQPARPGWIIDDLSHSGACGNAAAATEAEGQALLDTAAAGFANWLADFRDFEPGA